MNNKKTIVWFRKDLRLSDNPALFEASQQGEILPIYILEEDDGHWCLGEAQKWWLYNSLKNLDSNLRQHNAKLILRKGNPLSIISQLVKDVKADAVFWNRCYEPRSIQRDTSIKEYLKSSGIEAKSFGANLLFEPWKVKNNSGNYFKVFTPFWKSCNLNHNPRSLYSVPVIKTCDNNIESDDIDSWELIPTAPNWAKKFSKFWVPGENNAQNLLSEFIDSNIGKYATNRDIPGVNGTSRLSPYLHFGEISPHQIWYKIKDYHNMNVLGSSVDKYLAEIGWREFSYHLLYNYKDLPSREFNLKFQNFPWKLDSENLIRWQKGMTGYPIVDAGMRELWSTGWMHNRVRMIVASFLTKHLLISWQEGAKWFLDTLLDADLASNSAGWQWVAGCGADAAPYFRIFNPIMQGMKFDASGEYIRKWIPELGSVSNKYIHKPWEASKEELKSSSTELGITYPKPIIDHTYARNRALELYSKLA